MLETNTFVGLEMALSLKTMMEGDKEKMGMDLEVKKFELNPEYFIAGTTIRIEVEISSSFTQKDYETFTRLIDTTKRASAHLRSIRSVSKIDEKVHIGSILAADSNSPMGNDRSEEKETYIQENVLLACTAEICECYESLFARKAESSFPERISSVGTVLQCALTAQLYEHIEDQQGLSASGRVGASIGYVQSSLLQERSQEMRTIKSCVENGSVIETGTVQNLEE